VLGAAVGVPTIDGSASTVGLLLIDSDDWGEPGAASLVGRGVEAVSEAYDLVSSAGGSIRWRATGESKAVVPELVTMG